MQGCYAEPIECFAKQLQFDTKWTVHTDFVKFGPAPKHWAVDHVVLFRVTKTPMHKLMTPNAHFYGLEVYGFFIMGATYMRVKDLPRKHREHNMSLMLCTRSAKSLPEISQTQYYPSLKPWMCPVNLKTFIDVKNNDIIFLSPDPERVDVTKTKPENWVYTTVGQYPSLEKRKSYDMMFLVQSKVRRVKHAVKYAIVGYKMLPKIIQTPLHRDVGYHMAPGPSLSEKCLPGIENKELFFKTSQCVKEREDFYLGNDIVRITRTIKGGFYARRLLNT
jgi:hypothetical protein